MEEAKVEAQNAIDLMYDAEREAELSKIRGCLGQGNFRRY